MDGNFLELLAFKVSQPLGEFYITKIPAEELLKITYSSELRPRESDKEEILEFEGSQRTKKEDKLKQIGRFIDSVEASFPNSIILAANYGQEGFLIEDENIRWRIEASDTVGLYRLIIPTRERLASIVDGQHRLEGFRHVENSERLSTDLVCSIFIDLPVPYQAYLFSSINHNQTQVSKSLSYVLYGYNLDDETKDAWSTEKLAVYISRQLNSDLNSPFFKRIKVAPQIDKLLLDSSKTEVWAVSTATVVEGILTLITNDARRDRDELAKMPINKGRKRENIMKFEDDSPLRKFYFRNEDIVILKAVENFFRVAVDNLFAETSTDSFLQKTVGIQALFDILRENLKQQMGKTEINITVEYFDQLLSPLFNLNFADKYLQQSSAVGRARLRNFMMYILQYKSEFDPRDKDKPIELQRRLIKSEDLIEFKRIPRERDQPNVDQ